MEKTIQLKDGEVVICKPKAKHRNKAVIESWQNGSLNEPLFITKLLPLCVVKHPWGMKPVGEALGDLDVDEYDILSKALREFVQPGDAEKKSEQPLPLETPATHG